MPGTVSVFQDIVDAQEMFINIQWLDGWKGEMGEGMLAPSFILQVEY